MGLTHDVNGAGNVSDAVWEFMTSIKTVRKRSGNEEAFDATKLRESISRALLDSGMRDGELRNALAGQAITRLTRIFNGHSVPSTSDIRDTIVLTLIDHNLNHVARAYTRHRTQAKALRREEVFGQGLEFARVFTERETPAIESVHWETRHARIASEKGNVIFEQANVEVPVNWSQTATNVVVSKYFAGKIGTPERETSVRQLVGRVAKTIAGWGRVGGYFASAEDAETFEEELIYILVNQMAAFNSPVWFNVGVHPHPQCSACFINSVQDDMRSILSLSLTEGMLFKHGSGTGSNFSTLRSRTEHLSGAEEKASGPVAFMKGLDAFAGAIKSGGKIRRAAKMVILNVDHPDIDEFITCKAEEEKKAWALMDAGYDGSLDGEAYGSVFFQNANHSVRLSDTFMRAVEGFEEWTTKEVSTGKPSKTFEARKLMELMTRSAWQCGDPGVQFDTTINAWNTCKETARIHASNPCSEYMFLDDTACNLASLNLMKFRKTIDGQTVFDVAAFKHTNEIVVTAMEIIVGNSGYPTPAIEQNSLDFRPLGIGYANLGALIMSQGYAYDSDEGRNLAAALTSLQSGHAYFQSAKIAERIGPFAAFRENRESCMDVMRMHRDAAAEIPAQGVPDDLFLESRKAWDHVLEHAGIYGLRNAQISVLAPTGTIAFFMDCDTTGIEPDLALVKYKWLVGGGMIKIVNQTVPEALERLGYEKGEIDAVMDYVERNDTIEGAPHLKEQDLPVFDCAFRPAKGKRCIEPMGHVRMMASVQPFISGAISKTVNLPNEATFDDIQDIFLEAWKLGLKSIAVYRDGSKRQQAVTTTREKDAKKQYESNDAPRTSSGNKHSLAEPVEAVQEKMMETKRMTTAEQKLRRRRLPDERRSITHKFSVGDTEGYITVGLYQNGDPGEIFITMSKEGSVISGLMDSFATAVSIGLQYGVPLRVLVNKFVHMRFEPSGYTNNPNIRIAKSITDYIFRWMALKFLPREAQVSIGVHVDEENPDAIDLFSEREDESSELQASIFEVEDVPAPTPLQEEKSLEDVPSPVVEEHFDHLSTFDNQSDAPACDTCGSMMVRNASCYKCLNCGASTGCS